MAWLAQRAQCILDNEYMYLNYILKNMYLKLARDPADALRHVFPVVSHLRAIRLGGTSQKTLSAAVLSLFRSKLIQRANYPDPQSMQTMAC